VKERAQALFAVSRLDIRARLAAARVRVRPCFDATLLERRPTGCEAAAALTLWDMSCLLHGEQI